MRTSDGALAGWPLRRFRPVSSGVLGSDVRKTAAKPLLTVVSGLRIARRRVGSLLLEPDIRKRTSQRLLSVGGMSARWIVSDLVVRSGLESEYQRARGSREDGRFCGLNALVADAAEWLPPGAA
jgi:hypothetical protein